MLMMPMSLCDLCSIIYRVGKVGEWSDEGYTKRNRLPEMHLMYSITTWLLNETLDSYLLTLLAGKVYMGKREYFVYLHTLNIQL